MAAHTDFEPLSWEEAEQNRGWVGAKDQRRRNAESLAAQQAPYAGLPATLRAPPQQVVPQERRSADSMFEQCERLRAEIKRGTEYLDHIQRNLAESQSLLESWPIYEQNCGKNPLAHLTNSVLINQRVSKFLSGWVKRRERRLQAMTKAADKLLGKAKSASASKSSRNAAARPSKRGALSFPAQGAMFGKGASGRELVAA